MPEISIIVPVYKVEKYINKCVDSILNQTFQDFELILVDDGSPDNCGAICDEYAKKDKRVLSVHKKNGGLSDARNYGINMAKGKYIGFIDSDDYIADDMYEALYNNIVKYEADVSVCGIYDCYGEKVVPQDIKKGVFEFSASQAVEYMLSGKGVGLFAVNKLYKREVFKDVRYPVGKTYEDAFVIVDILLRAEKVVIDTTPKYYYIHRESSITLSNFSKKYYDILEAQTHNMELIEENFPDLKDLGDFRIWWAYKQILSRLALNDKETRKKFSEDKKHISKMIRKDLPKILRNKYNSKSQLVSYILISFCPNLFMKIYRDSGEK